MTVGAYNHGGQYGVTKYTNEAPELTSKITELLQLDFPHECFTSTTLVKNTYMPTHKDVFNDKDSQNLVSPLKVTEGAGVRCSRKRRASPASGRSHHWFMAKAYSGDG